jgi:hypothetical protein
MSCTPATNLVRNQELNGRAPDDALPFCFAGPRLRLFAASEKVVNRVKALILM